MVPEINLLPNLDKKKTAAPLIYIILMAVVAITLAFMIFVYFNAKSELTTLTNEESTLTEQRDNLQGELDNIQDASQGSLEQSVKFVETAAYPVTPLIEETQAYIKQHTYFREYDFGAESFTIKVDFETLKGISVYVENLLGSRYFSDVQVTEIVNFEIYDGSEEDMEADGELVNFKEVPRYTATITIFIDHIYLAGGEGA